MLKRDITYEDFNGEQATDTFYFNLTKTEILDLEVRHNGGLEASITRMVKAQDVKAVIDEVKYIILMAYEKPMGNDLSRVMNYVKHSLKQLRLMPYSWSLQ